MMLTRRVRKKQVKTKPPIPLASGLLVLIPYQRSCNSSAERSFLGVSKRWVLGRSSTSWLLAPPVLSWGRLPRVLRVPLPPPPQPSSPAPARQARTRSYRPKLKHAVGPFLSVRSNCSVLRTFYSRDSMPSIWVPTLSQSTLTNWLFLVFSKTIGQRQGHFARPLLNNCRRWVFVLIPLLHLLFHLKVKLN
ncbi:unnamed protein product [Dibothriocephalus latus]|uniref:Uncharacterized protein n=1 Tax=Dibothriocephalus latus TaxID=60516 RepID=A0A3P6QU85_DIBLA|nr:unnamed protein product [Dibothriocephalus latus]